MSVRSLTGTCDDSAAPTAGIFYLQEGGWPTVAKSRSDLMAFTLYAVGLSYTRLCVAIQNIYMGGGLGLGFSIYLYFLSVYLEGDFAPNVGGAILR